MKTAEVIRLETRVAELEQALVRIDEEAMQDWRGKFCALVAEIRRRIAIRPYPRDDRQRLAFADQILSLSALLDFHPTPTRARIPWCKRWHGSPVRGSCVLLRGHHGMHSDGWEQWFDKKRDKPTPDPTETLRANKVEAVNAVLESVRADGEAP